MLLRQWATPSGASSDSLSSSRTVTRLFAHLVTNDEVLENYSGAEPRSLAVGCRVETQDGSRARLDFASGHHMVTRRMQSAIHLGPPSFGPYCETLNKRTGFHNPWTSWRPVELESIRRGAPYRNSLCRWDGVRTGQFRCANIWRGISFGYDGNVVYILWDEAVQNMAITGVQ